MNFPTPTGRSDGGAVAAGYRVLGVYGQPESDWELAMRRDHGGEYGYAGYALHPEHPAGVTAAGEF
ncbi:hypothetical protein AB0436_05440 [Streptomyces sp. NPDC051322]|uniref:hypothetical protein n=1 Tax=Streptomyces sp. NPDC051322 TaxID=3154645 RepID=UPI00344F2A61